MTVLSGNPHDLFHNFDAAHVVDLLKRIGAASVPLLQENVREALVSSALRHRFREREREVKTSGVYQELTASDEFPPWSPFPPLRDALQCFLNAKFGALPAYPFSSPLVLNDLSLQRYEPGSKGITPHRDHKTLRNLICILVLAGTCRFCVCRDRSGADFEEVDASPGRMVFLRAIGFLREEKRPFHFIDRIPELRITLGLREETVRRIHA